MKGKTTKASEWADKCVAAGCPVPVTISSGEPCEVCQRDGRLKGQRFCKDCRDAWRKHHNDYLAENYDHWTARAASVDKRYLTEDYDLDGEAAKNTAAWRIG